MNHALAQPRTLTKSVRSAFTLIEVLVAIGIITILILLALPAFNFLTSSRGGEAANNQISSALGVARAKAVGVQQIRGLAIYRDPDRDRSIAIIVEARTDGMPVWSAGASANPINYTRGQYVQVSNTAYVCLESHVDNGTTSYPPASSPTQWREMPSMRNFINTMPAPVLEAEAGEEFMPLPKGVDVRGVGNEFRWPNASTGIEYRYTSPTVILFDANGQAIVTPFMIAQEGLVGQSILQNNKAFVPATLGSGTTALPYGCSDQPTPYRFPISSQIGLVAYDPQTFTNGRTSSTPADEAYWLDQNATPSMLNRYNGTLVRAE